MHLAEILVILLVALIVIKPDRLPEIAHLLGKGLGKIKRFYNEIMRQLNVNG